MKLGLMIWTLAGGMIIAHSQVSQPRRPYSPGTTALTNTNPLQRNLATNGLPGAFTNTQIRRPFLTNVSPAAQVATNRFAPTNSAAARRLSPAFGTNAPAPLIPSTKTGITNVSATNMAPGTNALANARAAITPLQRQSITRLTVDLGTIRPGLTNSASQAQSLMNTLRVGALGQSKPSPDAISKLVNDLVTGWPARGFTQQQRAQLALDFSRVLNSGNLSQNEALLVINDARRVLQTSGVSQEMVERLAGDLSAIANQLQQVQPPPNLPITPAPEAIPTNPP